MSNYLNLLPYCMQRRQLIVERLRQWGVVWLAAGCVVAGAAWSEYSRGKFERERLASLERRYTPLRQLQTKTAELRAQIAQLRQREEMALHIAEEQSIAALLGVLSRAAIDCEGKVCVTSLLISPGSAQKAAVAPHKALQLEGLGIDAMSVARFAAALRDADIFTDVRIRSSEQANVGAVNAVSYKLDCAW